MIDTGGQPELMEVMPCLLHNADLAIALLNLEYGLSELQQVDYHEKGEGYKRKTPSTLSSKFPPLSTENTIHNTRESQAYNIHCHMAAQYVITVLITQ